MFDISAFLSLKPAVPGADPALAQGSEGADFQAFGAILAGQVSEQATTATPASAVALALPAELPVAGNRQAGGNSLPETLPVLPDVLPVVPGALPVLRDALPVLAASALPSAEAPIALPTVIPTPAKPAAQGAMLPGKALTDILTTRMDAQAPSPESPPAPAAIQHRAAAAAPLAIGKRAADAKPAPQTETDSAEPAPQDDPVLVAPAPSDAAPATPLASLVLPESLLPVAASAQPTTPPAEAAEPAPAPRAAPAPAPEPAPLPAATSMVALAAAQALVRAAPTANAPQTAAPLPAQPADAAAPLPQLAVSDLPAAAEAAPAPITVLPAQTAAIAVPTASRFRVVAAPAKLGEKAPAEPIQPAAHHAVAIAAKGETPVAPLSQPMTVAAEVQPLLPQVNASPATVHSAAAPSQPGHDFAGLVDRLIEARDAAAPQSVHASVTHAEFGQVSLHFQQDAGGLTVAMRSADPDFTPAVQAAMPADRGGMASDTPSHSQSQHQPGAGASWLQQGGSQERGTDQQTRTAQERNPRSAAANPSQTAPDEAEPRGRGGIFI